MSNPSYDTILQAVAFAADQFLAQEAPWEESIQRVLKRLGQATQVSRVYMFENHHDHSGDLCTSQRFEWAAPGFEPQIDNPALQNLSWRVTGLSRWAEMLDAGHAVYGNVSDFPPGERALLEPQSIRSLILVPISMERAWWGFIGLDECVRERVWSEAEREALQAAARTLGAAILRERTERALREKEALLEQRVQERTQELATLLRVSQNISSTLDLDSLLRVVLTELRAVVEYAASAVFLLSGPDQLRMLNYLGPLPAHELAERWDLRQALHTRAVIERRAPVILPDVGAVTPLARAFRETAVAQLGYVPDYIGTWMGVPLIVKEEVIGLIALDHSQADYYQPHHAQLALTFAHEVAVAIENARLYHAEQERRAEADRRRGIAEGLREILGVLNSNRPSSEILDAVVNQAGRLFGAETAAAIYRLDKRTNLLSIQAAHDLAADYERHMTIPVGQGLVGRAVESRRPVFLDDLSHLPPDAALLQDPVRQAQQAWLREHYHGVLAVPLVIKGEMYGGLVIYYPEPRHFSDEEIELAVTFADQTALALENARMHEQGRQLAALEERQRLARELHDSVSQALYGIALGARTARTLLDRDPSRLAEPLDYVLSLAQAGLAEMRALIFELRPESLETEGLVAALTKQADSLHARYGVEVTARLCGEPPASLAAKEALYRIGQEALHNTVKHAHAPHVTLSLDAAPESKPQSLELQVCDDGVGFDSNGTFPGHLGLHSMRERAEQLGGTFDVESAPGSGTTIRVRLPLSPSA